MAVFPWSLTAADHVVEQLSGQQVHAFGRLVEHQQLGVVHQGLGQGQPLHHALAEAGDGLGGAVGQVRTSSSSCGTRSASSAAGTSDRPP